jgi:hypothetical protein
MCDVTVMKRPFVEAVKTFRSEPFRTVDLVERLGYSAGYARNFLSQATRQGLLMAESRKGKKEKTFRANPDVVREVVLRGGKEKDELLEALGLQTKYLGEYVALRGFSVVDHDLDLYRLSERVFSNAETQGEIVVTNVGTPKRIITVEI